MIFFLLSWFLSICYYIILECLDIILLLEECHKSGFFNKYFGGCNGIKKELNDCLTLEVINLYFTLKIETINKLEFKEHFPLYQIANITNNQIYYCPSLNYVDDKIPIVKVYVLFVSITLTF